MPYVGPQSLAARFLSHIDTDRPIAFRGKTGICWLKVFWAYHQCRHVSVDNTRNWSAWGRWPRPRFNRLDGFNGFLRKPHLKTLLGCFEAQWMGVQYTGPLHIGQ